MVNRIMWIMCFIAGAVADHVTELVVDWFVSRTAKEISVDRTQLASSTSDLCSFGDIGPMLKLAGAQIHVDTEAARAAQFAHICLGGGVSQQLTPVELAAELASRYPQCFEFEHNVPRKGRDGLAEGPVAGRLQIRIDLPPEQNALCGLPVRQKDGEFGVEIDRGSTWILCLQAGVGERTPFRTLVPACRLSDLDYYNIGIQDSIIHELRELVPK